MPSCLGLYIEKNLIKYAKVTKDHEFIKVEAYGIKFYDKIHEAISQIIAETFSYKIPISVNLSNEMYNYFNIFSLINKNDIPKAIDTEFESLCEEKKYNIKALETRNVIVQDLEDREKLRVVHVSANKTEINNKVQILEGNKLSSIVPVSMSISNLIDTKLKENAIIVNIEEKTSITSILNNSIYDIKILEEGSKQILDNINIKENSYQKAYDICKNTTIYTQGNQELQIDSNDYLDEIMPTLFNIVSEVKKIVQNSPKEIEKVYITGTGSVISNIDLYFSEYLNSAKCEILKPYFLRTGLKNINIKDFIEVNSAISLALNYLGVGVSGINFRKVPLTKKIVEILNTPVGGAKSLKNKKNDKNQKEGKEKKRNLDFSFDLSGALDSTEKMILRTAGVFLGTIIIFIISSGILTNSMKNKENEVEELIMDTNKQILKISSDNDKINSKTTSYQELIDNLNKINEDLAEKYSLKDAVPNLLNEIMYAIPKDVQIISIENTSGKKIKIVAQSEKYEQLGYFKGKIKNEGLLLNVISDQGVKNGDIVKTTIEGDLP